MVEAAAVPSAGLAAAEAEATGDAEVGRDGDVLFGAAAESASPAQSSWLPVEGTSVLAEDVCLTAASLDSPFTANTEQWFFLFVRMI